MTVTPSAHNQGMPAQHAFLAMSNVDVCQVDGCGQGANGPAHCVMPAEDAPLDAMGFAQLARALGGALRDLQLRTPAFRGNGSGYADGSTRYIRRYPAGATVGVKLAGRRAADVRLDMLVGACVANDLPLDNPKAHELASRMGVL